VGKYFSDENLWLRVSSLVSYGHDSSVWGNTYPPSDKGHVIEILSANYVSKPCWGEICSAADITVTTVLDIRNIDDTRIEANELSIFQFFFSDYEAASEMALKVQKSARNKRKDWVRDLRLVNAGGFHNNEVLEKLFVIQQGRCYYTGDPLIRKPKNYVVDHIQPIYLGGSDWPENLALVIREVNTWKGGLKSLTETLRWISRSRGKDWLASQKRFCAEVDEKREELDLAFRSNYGRPRK
jgi:HNH endonuclease.